MELDDPTPGHNPYAPPLAEDERLLWAPTRSAQTLNPWVSLWTRPRATIRQIVDTNPRYWALPLASLVGVATLAQNIAEWGSIMMVSGVLLVVIVGGLMLGLLMYLVLPWLYSKTAHWLGGENTLQDTRAAYAWGSYPSLFLIPVGLGYMALVSLVDQPTVQETAYLLRAVLQLVLGVWTSVTLCKCVGEVNRFSAWRGYCAVMIGWLLVMAILMAVGVAFFAVCLAAISMSGV